MWQLHLNSLQPSELLLIKPSLRTVVVRFQKRAQQLGILDVLPKIAQAQIARREKGRRVLRPSPLSASHPIVRAKPLAKPPS